MLIKVPKKPIDPEDKLYGQICLILMKAGVLPDEIDPCLEWAFGKNCLFTAPCNWARAWNKQHPEAFKAKDNEKFVEFIYVVGFLYKAAQKQAEISKNN